MELIQNVWTRFGFRGNPFDTAALSASGSALLPIAQAIVGREMESPESKMLLGVLRSAGGGRACRATRQHQNLSSTAALETAKSFRL